MLSFKVKQTKEGNILETSLSGKPLLTTPQLNKGTAFTHDERREFGLLGKLPSRVETLEEQVQRAYYQFSAFSSSEKRRIYLNVLHDTNQTLFYALINAHLTEMLPIIYTPVVGSAVKAFSREFRQTRGLYLAYPDRDLMEEIFANRSNPEIDLMVVTDGEGVLGIGDQGVGGIYIPVAKLMVYTLCGGIDPTRTLPILLDVGTNNQRLLNDPLYLGWRHPRIDSKQYDEFIEQFIAMIQRNFPNVFLHWEDLGARNARRNLAQYRSKICTFNDDMQGTGAVALSAILAATKVNKSQLAEQRIVVFGAGTAGTGIADQICHAMSHAGLSPTQARNNFWLIDREGLLIDNMKNLSSFQQPYARTAASVSGWQHNEHGQISLLEVVKQIKPTALIGCSAQTGAFTEAVVKEMAKHVAHPIILPLSNPTEKSEATPNNVIHWTQGKALVATGSPFSEVEYQQRKIHIAQCNNALVFPGIGLGVIAAKAKRFTDEMLWAACNALSQCAPILKDPLAPLLPTNEEAKHTAQMIAIAVAEQARRDGVAQIANDADIAELVTQTYWQPHYLPYKLVKNHEANE